MSDKPIYKSKKAIIAVSTVLINATLALLPTFFDLEPETISALHDLLVWVIPVGVLLIAGHSLQDTLTTLKGFQAPPREVNLPKP